MQKSLSSERKILISLLAVCMLIAFLPESSMAASKPARVKKPAVKVSKSVATITWKKAKKAKQYQVKIQNKPKKKWKSVRIARIANQSYSYTCTKPGTYRVLVRGWNGKKYGKWSKAKAFTIKKNNVPTGKIYSDPVPCNSKLKQGNTYMIKSPSGETIHKTKIDYTWSSSNPVEGYQYLGTTSDGGRITWNWTNWSYDYMYEGKGYEKAFSGWDDTEKGRIVILNNSDIVYVWTLDGTEPKIGQKDYVGTSKYALYMGQPVEMQLRGYFDKTRMKGTYEKEVLDVCPTNEWIKVYKGKRLIFEYRKVVHAEP